MCGRAERGVRQLKGQHITYVQVGDEENLKFRT
jgi:hypothetical protein